MPHFTAKMHRIRFRKGLRPRPRCGSLQRSPDSLTELRGRRGVGKDLGTGTGDWKREENGEGRRLGREGELRKRIGVGKGIVRGTGTGIGNGKMEW